MVEESTSKVFQLYRLAYSLIFCRTLPEILDSALAAITRSVGGRNAIFWQFSATEGSLEPVKSILEDKTIKTRRVSLGVDYLGEVYRAGKPHFLSAQALQQPNKHLLIPRDLIATTGLCVPFKGKTELEGVLEFISKSDSSALFSEEDADYVIKAMELVTVAATNIKSQEAQTRNQLNAITRLTLLYDISQIFNSTLELNSLLPIITEKIRDILDADTCTIWFLDDKAENIRCAKSMGGYEELFSNFSAPVGEDMAGQIAQQGEGVLLEDASADELLQKRFEKPEEYPVYTYLATPLECKGTILGTLEVMNRLIDERYNEEDQFLLNDLSHQAAISIHNANLLQAERKAKELDSLLAISHEITSTLNLDKVLLTIVNQAATLVPYDRAAIALIDRGKVTVGAVSGMMEVDQKSPELKDLTDLLTWSTQLDKGLYISEFDNKIIADREETREKFKAYFDKGGMKSFVVLPLKDEEGTLGILTFESATPYFLDERHIEVATILANQATVAIRNAQLYRQVPLLNLMEPIMQRKAQLMKMPKGRRLAWGGALLALLLLLVFVPWNMKVMGDVTVLPERRLPVVAQVEGIVASVPVREGTRLRKGDLIASLVDRDYKLALQQKQTERDLLLKEISRSQSLTDSTSLRLQQIRLSQVQNEIAFRQNQLRSTGLTAPSQGLLITPRIEEKVGSLLRKGEQFCEIADMNSTLAEISVDESEIGYLKLGQKLRLKMNAFPTSKFYGTVTHLGAEIIPYNNVPRYLIQAQIANPGLLLKSGMVGKAKVETGYRSVGYVLLRKPFRFLWKKFWVWLP